MLCYKCGQRIASSSLYCDFCGADQRMAEQDSGFLSVSQPAELLDPGAKVIRCRKCGIQLGANVRFCDFCGTDQFPPAKPRPVQRPAVQPEMKPEEKKAQPPVAQAMKQSFAHSGAVPSAPSAGVERKTAPQEKDLETETIKVIFCCNCGKRIDASRFCEFCGADQFPPPGRPAHTPVARPVTHDEPLAQSQYYSQSVDSSFAQAEPQQPSFERPVVHDEPFAQSRYYSQYADSSFAQSANPSFSQPSKQTCAQPVNKRTDNRFLKILMPVIAAVLVVICAVAVGIGISRKSDKPTLSGTSDSSASSQTTVADSFSQNTTTQSATSETTTQSTPVGSYDAASAPVLSSVPVNMTRTVFVYLVGSDLETNNGSATRDLIEMQNAAVDTTKVQVVVCAGGAKKWQNDTVSASETAYYVLKSQGFEKEYSVSAKNMADSNTLADFLTWGVQNYPADRYSLILWDHGGGPLGGYGYDELAGKMMSLPAITDALDDSPFGKGKKLEVLGFDACLMGTAEIAYAFRDYADYFIASQEIEPGFGWDYSFLANLIYCEDGDDYGKIVIDSYIDYCLKAFAAQPMQECDITLSCVDLSAVDAVITEINRLFTGVNSDITSGYFATVSRCRSNAKSFAKSSGTEYDLVDLMHLASLLRSSYTQAAGLESAIRAAVVYNKSNILNANGISVYHPYSNINLALAYKNDYKALDFADNYADYIFNFVSAMQNGSKGGYMSFSTIVGEVTQAEIQHEISIQLTEEQLQTFSSASYDVFWAMPADQTFSGKVEYLHIYAGQDITMSDHTLSASYSGKAVFGKDEKTGEYSDCPLAMYQIDDGAQEETFYFPVMFTKWYDLDIDILGVRWLMKIKDGVPTLLTAYRTESLRKDGLIIDKGSVDPEKYDYYTFANNSYFANTDADGNIVLEKSGSAYGFEYVRENGFSLELRPIEDKSQYYVAFCIEDIYGNSYYSAFMPLG